MKKAHGAFIRSFLLCSAAAVAVANPQLAYAQDSDAPAVPPQAEDPQATTPPDSPDTGAAAQTGAGDEIVVTGLRRNALLSEVPASISVVSAETLERDNITNIIELNGRLPSLVIGQQFGGARIAIRGIGFNPIRPGDEGRIAFYSDGVYFARPSAQIGTLFDVDRMEVLRGPQGTLYGRNATGGALLVTTRDPTRYVSGYLNATVGNYDLFEVSGAISAPIADTLSARFAFNTVNREGYWFNRETGNDIGGSETLSVRGTVLWEPSPDFDVRVTADRHRERDNNYVVHVIEPGYVQGNPFQALYNSRDINGIYDPINDLESYGASLRARYRVDEHLTFTGIGGYRHVRSDVVVHGSPGRIFTSRSWFIDDSEQYTADLQLVGDYDAVSFVVGASYFREDQTPQLRSAVRGRLFSPLVPDAPAQGTVSRANLISDAWALFGEVTVNVTPALSITGGLRYSWETKQALNEINVTDLVTPYPSSNIDRDFGFLPVCEAGLATGCVRIRPGFPRNSSVNFDSLTPKIAVNYEFSPNFSAYATYVEGFKSGGFNYGTIQDPYQPETIQNYEIGARARIFGNALTLRAAAFRYDYQALQQTVQLQNIVGTFVLNTGDARIEGIEAEFQARITPNFQIDGNIAVLDTQFGTFVAVDPNRGVADDIGGNEVSQAPEYTLYLGAQYGVDIGSGRATLRGDWRRTGDTYFDIFNNPQMLQEAYDVFGANLTYVWGNDQWRATLFVKNIGDEYATNFRAIQANALGGEVTGTLITPRTFGLTVGYDF